MKYLQILLTLACFFNSIYTRAHTIKFHTSIYPRPKIDLSAKSASSTKIIQIQIIGCPDQVWSNSFVNGIVKISMDDKMPLYF